MRKTKPKGDDSNDDESLMLIEYGGAKQLKFLETTTSDDNLVNKFRQYDLAEDLNTTRSIVAVNSVTLEKLRQMYPSFFLDIYEFEKKVKELLDKYGTQASHYN